MYLSSRAETAGAGRGSAGGHVARTVILLGLVSMFTDISSEAVTAVLPLYLTAALGMSPLAYGFIDGMYQGVSSLVRIGAGAAADRADRPKWVAFVGYGLSALSRLALIPSHGLTAVTAVITVDRLGKGIRTAPRDAMIATSAPPESLGRNFGVHRALDTVGAMLGPLLAFVVLWALPGDYASVFVASFAAGLVGLAVLGLVVPDLRPRRHEQRVPAATAPGAVRPSLALAGAPAVRRIVLVAAMLGLLSIGDGFLYLALQRRSDFAGAYFPLLYVGTNAVYLLLAVPLGGLADRWGRARVFVLGHVPLVLAFACVALPMGALPWVGLVLALLGVYYAATDGVVAALTSRVLPTDRLATGLATVQTVVAVARFASSVGFGLLWTLVGPTSALVGVAAVLVALLPVAWRVLRPLDGRGPGRRPTDHELQE